MAPTGSTETRNWTSRNPYIAASTHQIKVEKKLAM
jgi:hypothetical protein